MDIANKDGMFFLPPPVTSALDALEEKGYEAYAVGGCVRDLCRGVTPHDYDITTSATPEEVEACFSGRRIIETGIKHGTVTAIIDGEPLEITTYRTDGEYLDGRHPESVTFSSEINDDLSRRDFTINAMAYSPRRGLRDPFGGREDIEKKLVRCVGEPDLRFGEDGLRIMRALRFASSLGFEIEGETAASIHRNRRLLRLVSAERIYAEYKRLITGVFAARILTEFRDVMFTVMPELECLEGDEYENAVAAADKAGCDVITRTALLLGREENLPALRRLKPDGRTYSSVAAVLRHINGAFETDDVSLRRLLGGVSYENARRIVDARRARGLMTEDEAARVTANLNEMEARGECVNVRMLAVTGRELMELGVPEGARVGEILSRLLEEVITCRAENDKAELIKFAKAMREAQGD